MNRPPDPWYPWDEPPPDATEERRMSQGQSYVEDQRDIFTGAYKAALLAALKGASTLTVKSSHLVR